MILRVLKKTIKNAKFHQLQQILLGYRKHTVVNARHFFSFKYCESSDKKLSHIRLKKALLHFINRLLNKSSSFTVHKSTGIQHDGQPD